MRITGAHFGLIALKSREEDRIQHDRFGEAQSRRDITCHAKIGVLINGAWNQTTHVFFLGHGAEYGGKGLHETRSRLDGREPYFPYAVAFGKTEKSTNLIECDEPLNLTHSAIKFGALTRKRNRTW